MAISNAERQKRWRQKNRVLYNLRRRNRRKKNTEAQKETIVEDKPISKMDELRELVKMVSAEPVAPAPKLSVYRDDYGRVINETQWNALQKRRQQALAGGYVIDEYTQ